LDYCTPALSGGTNNYRNLRGIEIKSIAFQEIPVREKMAGLPTGHFSSLRLAMR
jgi:hypothetical protein